MSKIRDAISILHDLIVECAPNGIVKSMQQQLNFITSELGQMENELEDVAVELELKAGQVQKLKDNIY